MSLFPFTESIDQFNDFGDKGNILIDILIVVAVLCIMILVYFFYTMFFANGF